MGLLSWISQIAGGTMEEHRSKSQIGYRSRSVNIARTVTTKECPWLPRDVPEGTTVYERPCLGVQNCWSFEPGGCGYELPFDVTRVDVTHKEKKRADSSSALVSIECQSRNISKEPNLFGGKDVATRSN
jgi:hypothetical protein